MSFSPAYPHPHLCGGCAPQGANGRIYNPPGQLALSYRLSTHGTFLQQLLAQLPEPLLINGPSLSALTTRRLDDPTIALMDAWAMVADVLTFYQERIANEGFLRTATERYSVLELARAIGYELKPGVAASTYLAFTVDETTSAPEVVNIPKGTQIQSVPGQDQQPQIFETSQPILARAEWNALKAQQTELRLPTAGDTSTYLNGTSTGLRPGDLLLFMSDATANQVPEKWQVRRITTVEPDTAAQRTRVTWIEGLAGDNLPNKGAPRLFTFRQRASVFGHNAPQWSSLPKAAKTAYLGIDEAEELAEEEKLEWPKFEIFAPIYPISLDSGEITATVTLKATVDTIESTLKALQQEAYSGAIKSAIKVPQTLEILVRKVSNFFLQIPIEIGKKISALLLDVGSLNVQIIISISDFLRETIDEFGNIFNDLINAFTGGENGGNRPPGNDETEDPFTWIGSIVTWLNGVFDAFQGIVLERENSQDPRGPIDILNSTLGLVVNLSNDVIDAIKLFFEEVADFLEIPGSGVEVGDAVEKFATAIKETIQQAGFAVGILTNTNLTRIAVQIALDFPYEFPPIRGLLPPLNAERLAKFTFEFSKIVANVIEEGTEEGPGAAAFVAMLANPIYGSLLLAAKTGLDLVLGIIGNGSLMIDGENVIMIDGENVIAAGARKVQYLLCLNNETCGFSPNDNPVVNAIPGPPVYDLFNQDFKLQRKKRPQISNNSLDLNTFFPRIAPDTWMVLTLPNAKQCLTKITGVTEAYREDFTINSKTTRIFFPPVPREDPEEAVQVVAQDKETTLDDFRTEVRNTTVFIESEELEIAETPKLDPVSGRTIILDSYIRDLEPGQQLIASGRIIQARINKTIPRHKIKEVLANGEEVDVDPDKSVPAVGETLQVLKYEADSNDWKLLSRNGEIWAIAAANNGEISFYPAEEDAPIVSERVTVGSSSSEPIENAIPPNKLVTVIRLKPTEGSALQYIYDRTTFTLNANVAHATHGETIREEVIGSGDGTQANQRFKLKKQPLTYISSSGSHGPFQGIEPTLKVSVNGLKWQEVFSLYNQTPTSETYTVRIDNNNATTITFGDGQQGARPASGVENIIATYRSGIGLEGEVSANSLTLLKTRPLGIRSVNNPLPAQGAENPEAIGSARTNAPLFAATVDRIVSLKDYEDYARAFPGIAKAKAFSFWTGQTQLAYITIAGTNGRRIEPMEELFKNLKEAIQARRDPILPFEIGSSEPTFFSLNADVQYNPRYSQEAVKQAIKSALVEAFAFERREFGQGVSASEVITVIQQVEGVIAVDLNTLAKVAPNSITACANASSAPAYLPARQARWDASANPQSIPAELLLLAPDHSQIDLQRREP